MLAPGIAAYEFFLKVGIVLMGARFLVTDVARLGGIGLAMVVVEILFSIAFVSLFARWFRLPGKLGSLLSVGVGICGVSAIMGAAGSIEAEKEETGYAIAVILVFGAAALVAYPLIGRLLSMSDKLFGLWAGLAVDNTAEAVATGAIYSKAALAYTTLAKLCRNALMGFVILGFALYYARRGMAGRSRTRAGSCGRSFPSSSSGSWGSPCSSASCWRSFPARTPTRISWDESVRCAISPSGPFSSPLSGWDFARASATWHAPA